MTNDRSNPICNFSRPGDGRRTQQKVCWPVKAIGSWTYQRLARWRDVPTKELLLVDTNMTSRFLFLGSVARTKCCFARMLYFCFESFLHTKRGGTRATTTANIEPLNRQRSVHLQLSGCDRKQNMILYVQSLQPSVLELLKLRSRVQMARNARRLQCPTTLRDRQDAKAAWDHCPSYSRRIPNELD